MQLYYELTTYTIKRSSIANVYFDVLGEVIPKVFTVNIIEILRLECENVVLLYVEILTLSCVIHISANLVFLFTSFSFIQRNHVNIFNSFESSCTS